MSNYKWITFDCYGTLIDWEKGITGSFEKIAMAGGVSLDRAQLLKLYRKIEREEEMQYKKYRDVLTRVARRICFELGLQTNSFDFIVNDLPRWRPFPDTDRALRHLARNHKLGILSNIDNDLLAETRRHFPVNFDLIITAQELSSYKPNFNHFHEAKRRIGNAEWIHAAQSYFHDITPCKQLGIPSAWINRQNEVLSDKEPRFVFEGPDLQSFANWMDPVDPDANMFG
jgi:2-haloalkanoic acid dehalogenase type II